MQCQAFRGHQSGGAISFLPSTVTSKPYHLRENYLLENYLKGVRPTTLSVSHTLLTTPTDRLVGDSDTTLHKEFRQSRRPEREVTQALRTRDTMCPLMKSYRRRGDRPAAPTSLGEAGPHHHLLTAEHGQVRAVAKGVRKTTSKFGARVEPFSVIDAQLYIGRTLDTLTQVTSIAQYATPSPPTTTSTWRQPSSSKPRTRPDPADQPPRTQATPYLPSTCLPPAGCPSARSREPARPPLSSVPSYTLRALALAGWAPS